ncbi:MAG: allantoate amidohydrolase [Variibacter sp.]|nr:allantoate amidohydrolase [Variibacter sp.]
MTANALGTELLARAERLAAWSEAPEGLTCTFLSPAHRAVAAQLRDWMRDAGMRAHIDAAANVVGRYPAERPDARTLIVASHYDTVRNAGKYDGRLGILAGLLAVEDLCRQDRKLPFHVDLIGFSEEEGVRFSKPFIGSSAVAGRFDPSMLEWTDAAGLRLADALRAAGHDPEAIASLGRAPKSLLGYLELHIEQGPVLLQEDLPVGVVTAINGAVRLAVTVTGTAGHAGTLPMAMRHDAAAAAAEIVLAVERICSGAPGVVGTVGQLGVPNGATNIVPGRCELSLDVRASEDAVRDAALAEILAAMAEIAARRGVAVAHREVHRSGATACSPQLRQALAAAVSRAGIRPFSLASGAGHDAMVFASLTPIGMLFVRCGNGGISHNPLETVTAHDADVAVRVLADTLAHLGDDLG